MFTRRISSGVSALRIVEPHPIRKCVMSAISGITLNVFPTQRKLLNNLHRQQGGPTKNSFVQSAKKMK